MIENNFQNFKKIVCVGLIEIASYEIKSFGFEKPITRKLFDITLYYVVASFLYQVHLNKQSTPIYQYHPPL